MQTITSADKALKTLYLGVITDQMNSNVNPLLAKIKQSTQDVWGKEIKRLAQYGLNGGVGAGSESGALPNSGENYYEQFTLSLKNLYGTIAISDKAIRASENNSGAFVNLLNAEMEGLIKAASFNLGRMLYGDGSGVIATVTGVGSGCVMVDNVKNLTEGMIVDFYDEIGEDIYNGKGRRIVSVDRINKAIYLSGASFSSDVLYAGAIITMQNSLSKEITGLGAIFKEDGMLYGLNRSNNKWLVPYIKRNVGDISEMVIQKAIDDLEENAGSKVNFIVCSAGVKRAFINHLATYKRNVDVLDLQGGYKALSYNGIPIVSDRFCPDGTMYLLNTDDFTMHQLCDWRWLEGEDGKVLKQVAGTPTYTATLVKYADIICAKPCGQGMLSGITEA